VRRRGAAVTTQDRELHGRQLRPLSGAHSIERPVVPQRLETTLERPAARVLAAFEGPIRCIAAPPNARIGSRSAVTIAEFRIKAR
jgi:hypothetical protein